MTPERLIARTIVFHDDSLLLIRRHNSQGKYYTLPGGGIEPGETETQAAVRETLEETSIQVTIDRKVYQDASPKFGNTVYYAATYIGGEPAIQPGAIEESLNAQGDEEYEPLWLHVSELAKVNLLPLALKLELLLAIDQGLPEKVKTLNV